MRLKRFGIGLARGQQEIEEEIDRNQFRTEIYREIKIST
jgi:hypothetical protein